MYTKIWWWWPTFIEHHLQPNLGFRSGNFVFTGAGFNIISGFSICLFSQEMDSMLIQFSQNFGVNQKIDYMCWDFRPPSWKTKQYIGCTLRSGLNELPIMIRTIPHGLENNHACKWISDNFPGMLTLYYSWKIVKNPFACLVVLQSTWKGPFFFLKVWDRLVP